VPYWDFGPKEITELLPILDTRGFGPPALPSDARFGTPTKDAIAGALYIPESGLISDPKQSTHNVQRAAEAKGGKFLFNAQVAEIRKKDNQVQGITLADGTQLDAPVVINVAGPHSFQINRMAGVEDEMNIKTRALRQEVCHVPAPEGFDYNHLGTIISDGDVGCYSRPEVGNHILIGSEDPECDTLEYIEDPDNYNTDFTEQWTTQVMREAQRIPEMRIPNKPSGIVDLYDCTDDWIPIYDKSSLKGFYMAVGTSGNQFKNAPVAGAFMAQLVQEVENGHDHDKDPVHFTMKYTKRPCNIGFYSRLRKINPDSSFSVIG
jgi:sarcosine oxidase subunit beta